MNKFLKISLSLIIALSMCVGCSDLLEETPRTLLTPETFKTATGLQNGLVAAYALFRPYYGFQGGTSWTVFGDEFMQAQQYSDPPEATYVGFTPAVGGGPWNDAYPAINTCNGIIQLGPEASGLTEAEKTQLIAEAKFLRAHWYFLLARHYGGATIDLGSGPLAFNESPTTELTRSSEADVMEVVINDLEDAVAELPESRPSEPGRVWKASALHLLAKAYLWRGWRDYSPNPNADYQAALDNATDLINNRGSYGVDLVTPFADVFAEGNEWSSEVLFTIEWNGNQQFNNAASDAGNFTNNIQNFLFREFYVQDIPGMVRDVENGRPWIRYSPTAWMLDVAFEDKVNDERYHGSFQTVWYANDENSDNYPVWTQAEADAGYVDASMVGEQKFELGDTAYWHAPKHIQDQFATEAAARDWALSKGYQVTFPDYGTSGFFEAEGINYQNKHFPSLSKFNRVARPIPGTEEDPNIGSTRPFIVHRFAETFLVAAEAAIRLGQAGQAVDFINEIRERANALPIDAGDLTGAHGDEVDFVLDERTRELAGEHLRWFDLKRTNKLLERVRFDASGAPAVYNRQYNDGAPAAGQLAPQPEPYHLLRPVPQGAIDAVTGEYAQNPGYN